MTGIIPAQRGGQGEPDPKPASTPDPDTPAGSGLFDRAELLSLQSEDLATLLRSTGYTDPVDMGRTLGLHMTDSQDRAAVYTALECEDPITLPISEAMTRSVATGQPFLAGTFAIYGHPTGAIVVVTDEKNRGVERNTIPPALVKMTLQMASGGGTERMSPLSIFSALRGKRRG